MKKQTLRIIFNTLYQFVDEYDLDIIKLNLNQKYQNDIWETNCVYCLPVFKIICALENRSDLRKNDIFVTCFLIN